MSQLKKWKEVPRGGLILKPGSAAEYETGTWRTFRPIHHEDKCIQCLRCWIYCPDAAVIVKDGKVVGFDYVHCKGCGICARECPAEPVAITMSPESDFDKE